MANAKKAPSVPNVVTAPKAKPIQKGKVQPLILTGFEKQVDLAYKKNIEVKEAEKAVEMLRVGEDGLDKRATDFRAKHEADGHFTKTVLVKGSEANASYSFKDSYSKIDVSVEEDLKKLLGGEYGNLFTRRKDVSIKKGSLDKIIELAKQHGFTDLLEEDEYLLPVDEFREVRADKRAVFTTEQNDAIDKVVVQVASKPTLTFK